MSEGTQVGAAETETLRQAYAALNRNDTDAMVDLFDPQMEWTDPVDSPMAGTYRGHAELKAHFSKTRATWDEGSCEPERFVVCGDKIVVFVHVHVRLKQDMRWVEADLTDVYTFRNGKAVRMRSFVDRRAGLEWAGCPPLEA